MVGLHPQITRLPVCVNWNVRIVLSFAIQSRFPSRAACHIVIYLYWFDVKTPKQTKTIQKILSIVNICTTLNDFTKTVLFLLQGATWYIYLVTFMFSCCLWLHTVWRFEICIVLHTAFFNVYVMVYRFYVLWLCNCYLEYTWPRTARKLAMHSKYLSVETTCYFE